MALKIVFKIFVQYESSLKIVWIFVEKDVEIQFLDNSKFNSKYLTGTLMIIASYLSWYKLKTQGVLTLCTGF